MTGGDIQKLNAAGFRVFYRHLDNRRIMESVYGSVKLYAGPFKSKAEMLRAWYKLMENPKHVER